MAGVIRTIDKVKKLLDEGNYLEVPRFRESVDIVPAGLKCSMGCFIVLRQEGYIDITDRENRDEVIFIWRKAK